MMPKVLVLTSYFLKSFMASRSLLMFHEWAIQECIVNCDWPNQYEWAVRHSSSYQAAISVSIPFLWQKTLLVMLEVQFNSGHAFS